MLTSLSKEEINRMCHMRGYIGMLFAVGIG